MGIDSTWMVERPELFLSTERQSSRTENAEAEACLARLRDMMARVEPFRPTGSAWQALQREGAELASTKKASAPAGTATPALSASPKEGFTGKEIVVKPDAKLLDPKETPTLTKIQPYSWKQGGRIVLELTGASPREIEAMMRLALTHLDSISSRLERRHRQRYLDRWVAASILREAQRLGLEVVVDAGTGRIEVPE